MFYGKRERNFAELSSPRSSLKTFHLCTGGAVVSCKYKHTSVAGFSRLSHFPLPACPHYKYLFLHPLQWHCAAAIPTINYIMAEKAVPWVYFIPYLPFTSSCSQILLKSTWERTDGKKKPKDSFHKKQRLWIPWKKIPTEKKSTHQNTLLSSVSLKRVLQMPVQMMGRLMFWQKQEHH